MDSDLIPGAFEFGRCLACRRYGIDGYVFENLHCVRICSLECSEELWSNNQFRQDYARFEKKDKPDVTPLTYDIDPMLKWLEDNIERLFSGTLFQKNDFLVPTFKWVNSKKVKLDIFEFSINKEQREQAKSGFTSFSTVPDPVFAAFCSTLLLEEVSDYSHAKIFDDIVEEFRDKNLLGTTPFLTKYEFYKLIMDPSVSALVYSDGIFMGVLEKITSDMDKYVNIRMFLQRLFTKITVETGGFFGFGKEERVVFNRYLTGIDVRDRLKSFLKDLQEKNERALLQEEYIKLLISLYYKNRMG